MSIAAQVRKNYQRRPYPSLQRLSPLRPYWDLPSMVWISAVLPNLPRPPARILVAGCGTGNEAFALRNRFTEAEIIALDFSPHAIALARNGQRQRAARARERPIRFAVCDLGDKQFDKIVTGQFDFIICHGVLSYIPKPVRVLRRLRARLAEQGALYLGVNGAAHFSSTWRKVLPGFGFNVERMPDNPRLRPIIALLDHLSDSEIGRVARREPAFLSGDLFGPLLHNWPLADWVNVCAAADLHLAASHATGRAVREAINHDLFQHLLPRSRAEMALMVDLLQPDSFHRLLFTKQPLPSLPWKNISQLCRWRPLLAPHLHRQHWPKHRGRWTVLRNYQIKIAATNTRLDLRVPAWLIQILRQSRGQKSLGQILREIAVPISSAELQRQLYVLYHLDLVNLEKPQRRSRP